MIQHEGFWTCYEHCPACAEYAGGDAGADDATRCTAGHESVGPHPRVASTRGLPKKTLG